MKKRLLIMHPYLATYRIDVYNQLNRDCKLEVLLYGSKREKQTLGFDLQKVKQRAEFKYTEKDSGWYLGRHLISLIYYKVIRRFRPDIILAHELGVDTLAAVILKPFFQYKLFITVDDNLQMAEFEYGKSRKMLRNFVVHNIDGYVCVSQLTQNYLQRIYPRFAKKFLYFPIIQDDESLTEKINSSEAIAREYCRTYNLEGKKIILFVGRFEPVKRIDLILQAYSECRTDDSQLVLVGGGSLVKEMKHETQKLGIEDKVIFTGSLSGGELYAWYYLAHLFVLASNHEAFGAVVNESLVAGCRAIVSDHCGSSSIITEENGSVFESENLSELIACMKREINYIEKSKIHTSRMPESFNSYYRSLAMSMGIY